MMASAPDVGLDANFATRVALMMVAGFVFIILGLAGAHFFRRPVVGQGLRFRLHQAASILFAIVHLAAMWEQPSMTVGAAMSAIVLYAIGLCLFLWTQETTKQQPPFLEYADIDPDALLVWGPFKIIRHPFYLSYMLVWLAGAAATLSPWVAATAAIMCVSYIIAAREEEAAFLRTRFAAEYRGYSARTGMWLPRPRQLFDWPWEISVVVVIAIIAAIFLTGIIVLEIFTNPGMR